MLKLAWTPNAPVVPDNRDRADISDSLTIEQDGATAVSVAFARPAATPLPVAAVEQSLRGWLGDRPRDRRVVLMVHGFQYDPIHGGDDGNPFSLIYGVPAPASTPPRPHPQPDRPDPSLSWLPIVGETTADGGPGPDADGCIAFAWLSQGGFFESGDAGWPSMPGTLSYLFPAFDLVPLAARALATVMAALQSIGQAFDVLAHSLGTRATCQAIGLLRDQGWKAGILRRAVLLDGAEYMVDASQNLLGGEFEVINFVNRTDWVVTYLAQKFSAPVRPVGDDSAKVIGARGLRADERWLDIQLAGFPGVTLGGKAVSLTGTASDRDEAVHSFASFNHWVCYMADDNRAFLHDLLRSAAPEYASVAALKAALPAFGYADTPFDWTVPPTPQTVAERIAQWEPKDTR